MTISLRTGVIAAVLVVVAGLAGWLVTHLVFMEKEKPLVEQTGPVKPGAELTGLQETKVPVIFFYASPTGLAREEKAVTGNPLPVKMAEGLVLEYIKGLPQELRQTMIKGIYRDSSRILYLDLSDDFRRSFSGDARYEYYVVKGLYQTIITNVPDIRDVRILIEGREVETIGGHVSILRPLKESLGN
jgi:hypothetical protein